MEGKQMQSNLWSNKNGSLFLMQAYEKYANPYYLWLFGSGSFLKHS